MYVGGQYQYPSYDLYAAARDRATQMVWTQPVHLPERRSRFEIEAAERRAAEQQEPFDRTGPQTTARLLGAVAGAAYLALPCAAICLPQSTQWWAWTATGAAAAVGGAAGAAVIRGGHCTPFGRTMAIICGYLAAAGASIGAAVAYGAAEQARFDSAQAADPSAASTDTFSLNVGAAVGIALGTFIGVGLVEHAIIRLTRCI